MRLPAELVHAICADLQRDIARSTLDKVSRSSTTLHAIATPYLYDQLRLREDADYVRLLDTYEAHRQRSDDRQGSPLRLVRHVQVAHFPSSTICKRIAHLAGSAFLLDNVQTLTFPLPSTHSILWGPMYILRHPHVESRPPDALSGSEMIASFARLASPRALCVHLNRFSAFDRDWNLFFQLVCQPWTPTLTGVNVHGMEYWLKAFVPGVPHAVFLDHVDVPYRPGTGMLVPRQAGEARTACVDTWCEVLLAVIQDGHERDVELAVEGRRTSWTLHCPGARVEELVESEEALIRKIASRCPGALPVAGGSRPPLIELVTDRAVPCSICEQTAPTTTTKHRLGCGADGYTMPGPARSSMGLAVQFCITVLLTRDIPKP